MCKAVSSKVNARERAWKLHTQKLLLAPEAFDVGDAFFCFVGGEGGAEFEDFDVVRFDAGFERGEIDVS